MCVCDDYHPAEGTGSHHHLFCFMLGRCGWPCSLHAWQAEVFGPWHLGLGSIPGNQAELQPAPCVAGRLPSYSTGESRIPHFFSGARGGMEACSCFSRVVFPGLSKALVDISPEALLVGGMQMSIPGLRGVATRMCRTDRRRVLWTPYSCSSACPRCPLTPRP